MIQLPNKIITSTHQIGYNAIYRLCAYDNIQIDETCSTVISLEPFKIDVNGHRFFLTKNSQDAVPDDCEYGVITSKKPKLTQFLRGEITCLNWLKHPMIKTPTPQDIVDSWAGKFFYTKEDKKNDITGLRTPQIAALYAFMSHAQSPKERSIIVMPTGTGKTETMLSILVANQCQKILITVPSDALRSQLADKFITLGYLPGNIIDSACLNPYVAVIQQSMDENEWRMIIKKSNVVVTTMPLLCSCSNNVKQLLNNSFTHVFVDEAHHSEAPSWQELINSFSNNKVTLFTATPFRNDGKKLQGKFIYTFSLKDAQLQGYYKPINFIPVREYDFTKSDQIIANTAVVKLRQDIAAGYNHILMARCDSTRRAIEVFMYYSQYNDLNPVMIHSKVTGKNKIVEDIRKGHHKIIVCVNMLGEGFDLPEMKIAAIHDPRQSLPVTLQFIGRFTRTSYDNSLGEASFVANIADKPMEMNLQDLYNRDSDWNILLPLISDQATQEQIDFNQFIQDFRNVDASLVPFQSIQPALSTVIFNVDNNEWNPNNWQSVFTADDYDYRFGSVNSNGDTLVIVLGRIEKVEFGRFEGIQNLQWGVVLVHWNVNLSFNHVYVNTSLGSIDSSKLVKSLFTGNVEKITGPRVFRVFSGVTRFAVQTFGGRKMGDISFKSFVGKDVEEGIRMTEQRELTKNNIFGIGYRNGERISIGCSIKGKVWSYMRGNIKQFSEWCRQVGNLIEDNNINENIVLQNTLKVKRVGSVPPEMPIGIDWDVDLYRFPENKFMLIVGAKTYEIGDVDLSLINAANNLDTIEFSIQGEDFISEFKIDYSANVMNNETYYSYNVSQTSGFKIKFAGVKTVDDICEYFNDNNSAPVIYFANGAQLFANNYVETKNVPPPIANNCLYGIDWTGVDLSKESQHVVPYETDSIQYHFSQIVMNDFDVLYDDDGSGEIADLIGIKVEAENIHIHLYHLKFAHNGNISDAISNFYEVCGQTQKCLKWRNRDKTQDFFRHLFRRLTKTYQGRSCSRLLHGTIEQLEQFEKDANWKKDLKFHINIVQPAFKVTSTKGDIRNLLGCVATYLMETANVDLKVYGSN